MKLAKIVGGIGGFTAFILAFVLVDPASADFLGISNDHLRMAAIALLAVIIVALLAMIWMRSQRAESADKEVAA